MITPDKLAELLQTLAENHLLSEVTSDEIKEAGTICNIKPLDIYLNFIKGGPYRAGWGKHNLTPLLNGEVPTQTASSVKKAPAAVPVFDLISNQSKKASPKINSFSSGDCFVPDVDPTFVAWGEYSTIRKIIESRQFFPVYISGMSGTGKTLGVEQACARLGREYIRLQVNPETDSDTVIGGFRLINGETVFCKGPLVKAMEAGAILLADELDRGNHKLHFALNGACEGKPILIPQTGEIIVPQPGFNVIATANTKGRGSDDGRYSAANIIDEAFLERFVITIDQPYPGFKIERNIVAKHMEAYGVNDEEFADKLVAWSAVIRKTYDAEGVDELISTRRLCHIIKAYSIFKDRVDAIKMCVARFEIETREAFLDLYQKIDAGVIKNDTATDSPIESSDVENVPF